MMEAEDFLRLRERAARTPVHCLDVGHSYWIFGAGSFGRSLAEAMQAQGIAVAGFVETAPRIAAVQGLPVLDWSALVREAPRARLVLGIFNRGMPYDQLLALPAAAGFEPPLMPWMFYESLEQSLGWRFWLSSRTFLLDGLDRIAQVAQHLSDTESISTLHRICAFRLGLDMDYASFRSTDRQYFNALTLPALQGRDITYIDCGAYDGDTFEELLIQPGITCVHAFLLEPDPDNYALLAQRILKMNTGTAICLPLAAAQGLSRLTFSAGQGEACTIVAKNSYSAWGESSVTALALDELLPCMHAHFIKLDIEGSEAQALHGARQLIQRSRPVLAVSLYHNPQDLWELPELLFELCGENYRFYVRQHGFNSFDAVLYAIPFRTFA